MSDLDKRMTLSEIEDTAAQYGVSIRAYLEGLDNEKYMTAQGKKRNDLLQKVSVTMEQNRQRTQAANAQLRQANRPNTPYMTSGSTGNVGGSLGYMQLHQKQNSTPGYAGKASGSCCGNCRYYMPDSNKCVQNQYRHPSGASYYCGSYCKM